MNSFGVKVNLDVREVATLRKNVETAQGGTEVNVNEFLDKINTGKPEELAAAYDKFKGTVSDEKKLKELFCLLDAFTAIFIYHINLIYESWYKSKPKWYKSKPKWYQLKPKQPMNALQILEEFQKEKSGNRFSERCASYICEVERL